MFKVNLILVCTAEQNISQIFPESQQPTNQKNCENMFADLFSETPGTPVSRLCSEIVLKYFKRKNHFKVNVWSRPSNWHINKNLQKIKPILYQDSCWINRAPWRNHLAVCKHLGWLILKLLLQALCTTDLETDAANTLLNWSQDCCCEHLA